MSRSFHRLVCLGFCFIGFSETVVSAQGLDRLKLAEEATKRRPDDGLAFLALGTILHHQRQFVEAHRALRRAEQLLPGNPEIHRLLGLNYYVLEQYRLFEEQMLTAKALKPEDAEFDYWLGRYHQMVSGDYNNAISFFNRAISLDSSNYKALYNRGDCYDENGDLASAEKDYLTAVKVIRKRAVTDSWPFQALGGLYLRTGRNDESLALASEAVAMEANVAENHLVLGKVLSERGDTSGAIRELEDAAILDPTDARVRYQLYRLHVKAGNFEAGKSDLAAYRELVATYRVDQGIK